MYRRRPVPVSNWARGCVRVAHLLGRGQVGQALRLQKGHNAAVPLLGLFERVDRSRRAKLAAHSSIIQIDAARARSDQPAASMARRTLTLVPLTISVPRRACEPLQQPRIAHRANHSKVILVVLRAVEIAIALIMLHVRQAHIARRAAEAVLMQLFALVYDIALAVGGDRFIALVAARSEGVRVARAAVRLAVCRTLHEFAGERLAAHRLPAARLDGPQRTGHALPALPHRVLAAIQKAQGVTSDE